jgi:hypothetical protein
MKRFSALLLAVFVAALAHAQTPATDMKTLVGRRAVVQRVPFYQPGTYQTIPNIYAGQTVTIIEVKPSAMFASIPKLTAGQMASLPSQSRENIENVRNASILVVQFADGTKADTGAMPVMPSNLPSYLEIVGDPVASGPAVIASVAPTTTNPSANSGQGQTTTNQPCPVQPTNVKYAGVRTSLAMSIIAGLTPDFTHINPDEPIALVQFSNQSRQEVKAIRLGIQYFDAVDSPTYTQSVMYQAKLKVNKSATAMSQSLFGTQGTHLVAYIDRIKFKDGSVWNDDGSHSCAVETIK